MHPVLVRHLIHPLHERLRGRGTTAELRALMRTDRASADELRAIQTSRLRSLLTHAAACCPEYARRIAGARIDPAMATLDGLRRIEPITRGRVRDLTPDIAHETGGSRRPRTKADFGPLCDATAPHRLLRCATGGSSGDPLVFYLDPRRQAADVAARARTRRWFGIDVGERELYVWGSPVELSAQDRLKALRDWATNHRLASAFDPSADAMQRHVEALLSFRPAHLFGYPSSIARLAATMRQRRTAAPESLRSVFVTGEVLAPDDRATIADSFGVPVADGYGSREAGFIAHECPRGRLHVTMEHVIVELLDQRGEPARDGEPGEITVTHLTAYGMPFIRYRTGDFARRDPRPCECGRAHDTLASIEGRRGDHIRLPGGGAVHPLCAIYPLRECGWLAQFEVVQRDPRRLEVRVVPATVLTDGDRSALRSSLAARFAGQLQIDLQVVADIPPSPSGKHRPVRCLLPQHS